MVTGLGPPQLSSPGPTAPYRLSASLSVLVSLRASTSSRPNPSTPSLWFSTGVVGLVVRWTGGDSRRTLKVRRRELGVGVNGDWESCLFLLPED